MLTPDEVLSVLKSLVDGKAFGPNGLNNKVLKGLASEISEPLCSLYAPTFEKVGEHIGFGLSVFMYVCMYV